MLCAGRAAAGEEDALMDMDRREQAFTGLVKGGTCAGDCRGSWMCSTQKT
jgi:hypothetical protein